MSSEILKDWKAAAVIPSSKGVTLLTQTATDLYLSYPAFLMSSKAKSTNRLPTISESHHNFSAMQSGFRAGHGCTSATLKVLNDIITAIDKRHYCAAVFLDLAKAFDSVNHNILIGRSEEHTSELQSL